MRVVGILLQLALGLALAGAMQWASSGAAGLPAAAPPWLAPALPLILAAGFGAYLALTYGAAPGPALGALGALVALAVAALPLAYTYGLAQRHGLPADGGAIGTWLAGPYARSAAAVWLLVAAIQAFRRPGPARARAAAGAPAERGAAELWLPEPSLPAAEPGPVAYTPPDSEPG